MFRAGFGIYTNQAAYSVLQNLAENAPFFLVKTLRTRPKPVYTTENILNFNPTGAIGANGVNHNFAIEYNEVWNAAIQKQLGGTLRSKSAISDRARCMPTVPPRSTSRKRSGARVRFRSWPRSPRSAGTAGRHSTG